MQSPHFSGRMKMAELIHVNHRLLTVLPRFGIRLGFGEKSVADICAAKGVSVPLFLMVCNVYTFDDYLPEADDLQAFSADELTDYLRNSHLDYSQHQIPDIRRQVQSLAENLNTANRDILNRFFDDYTREIINHFGYEESTVFPYVHQLTEPGEQSDIYSIDQFQENHSNIEEKLNDLKNIIIKYLPPDDNCRERNHLLIDLFMLEEDINKHSLIEDRILVPWVQQLEAARR